HVINNSWTCPPEEGCDWDALQSVVENVRAAGIVVVASAGNDGSSCSTVQDPPAIYAAAFSVGATDSSDNIAGFSSRGPVTRDGSNRPKPDVSAPGVSVRSSVPGGGYGWKSGTSMAGPHVAGTVALLLSAAPRLIGDVGTTEWIIEQTARPRTTTQTCGDDNPGDVPNNVYGWGIVDALAAVRIPKVTKRSAFSTDPPVHSIIYTLTVANTSNSILTQIVLTDTIPTSTLFAWASGSYTHTDSIVTWTTESLASQEMLTATLIVTVEHLSPGTRVINSAYGVRASEWPTSAMGLPVEMTIPWPWHHFLPFISRDWSSGGNNSD
ncbi:MAG: S8 family serine peptidase, partial [Chloroflexi bacterium]|nr:S8 family serine peptidase [Chloroflexota bacterium]